jgi:hypothetical protein
MICDLLDAPYKSRSGRKRAAHVRKRAHPKRALFLARELRQPRDAKITRVKDDRYCGCKFAATPRLGPRESLAGVTEGFSLGGATAEQSIPDPFAGLETVSPAVAGG